MKLRSVWVCNLWKQSYYSIVISSGPTREQFVGVKRLVFLSEGAIGQWFSQEI